MNARRKLFFFGKGGAPAPGVVATGGTVQDVTISGTTYRVHTFTNSGDLVVERGGEIEYFFVAGAGGGGRALVGGGGGGAGGLKPPEKIDIPIGTYPIVVGKGGLGRLDSEGSGLGTSGSDSSAFGQTITGGGYGGDPFVDGGGGNGGSGGGGGAGARSNPGGEGIEGQGNRGGNGFGASSSLDRGGGAGGGYNTVGGDGQEASRGIGGEGLELNFDGTLREYARGGDGNEAGFQPLSPEQNTGNGGFGGGDGFDATDGADGVFKLRYRI